MVVFSKEAVRRGPRKFDASRPSKEKLRSQASYLQRRGGDWEQVGDSLMLNEGQWFPLERINAATFAEPILLNTLDLIWSKTRLKDTITLWNAEHNDREGGLRSKFRHNGQILAKECQTKQSIRTRSFTRQRTQSKYPINMAFDLSSLQDVVEVGSGPVNELDERSKSLRYLADAFNSA